jgi:hypothetical protein
MNPQYGFNSLSSINVKWIPGRVPLPLIVPSYKTSFMLPRLPLFPTVETVLSSPHQMTLSQPTSTTGQAPDGCSTAVGPKPGVSEPLLQPLDTTEPPPDFTVDLHPPLSFW